MGTCTLGRAFGFWPLSGVRERWRELPVVVGVVDTSSSMAWTPRLMPSSHLVCPFVTYGFFRLMMNCRILRQEVTNTYSSSLHLINKEKEKNYVYTKLAKAWTIYPYSTFLSFPCPPLSLCRPGRVRDGTQDLCARLQ